MAAYWTAVQDYFLDTVKYKQKHFRNEGIFKFKGSMENTKSG